MPSLKLIANNVNTINNKCDKARQQKNKKKLKEDIKHRQKGVGLEKNKTTDRWEQQKTHAKTKWGINRINKLKLNKKN